MIGSHVVIIAVYSCISDLAVLNRNHSMLITVAIYILEKVTVTLPE